MTDDNGNTLPLEVGDKVVFSDKLKSVLDKTDDNNEEVCIQFSHRSLSTRRDYFRNAMKKYRKAYRSKGARYAKRRHQDGYLYVKFGKELKGTWGKLVSSINAFANSSYVKTKRKEYEK